MYKYVITIAVTIIVACIFIPKILAGLTAWSDRRWERRQERYEWRQEKRDGRWERFWRDGDKEESEPDGGEDHKNQKRFWGRFESN